jgi:hypothetical protein
MRGKRIETYQSVKTVHECRLYSDDYRRLFKLPLSKGKIVEVKLVGQTVIFTFEVDRYRSINFKLTGGK